MVGSRTKEATKVITAKTSIKSRARNSPKISKLNNKPANSDKKI